MLLNYYEVFNQNYILQKLDYLFVFIGASIKRFD
jgi:hypothetical protein